MMGSTDQHVVVYQGVELIINHTPIELEDGGKMHLAVLGAQGLPLDLVVKTTGEGKTIDEAMENCLSRLKEMLWKVCGE